MNMDNQKDNLLLDKEKINNEKNEDQKLNKEVNKIYCLKITNLIASFILFITISLLFYLIFKYFSSKLILNLFPFISFLVSLILLITNISSVFCNISKTKIMCSNHLLFLKYLILIFCILFLIWTFLVIPLIVYYFIQKFKKKNIEFIIQSVIGSLICNILFLFQLYCFSYYNYFFKRRELYIVYCRKLIVKYKEKEKAKKIMNIFGITYASIKFDNKNNNKGEELIDILE